MLQVTAGLVQRAASAGAQELTLHAPALAAQLAPGRAVLLRPGWGSPAYLRRTFYPIAFDAAGVTIRVPYGTDWGHAWFHGAPIDTGVDCLGPVGNGFVLHPRKANILCVGAGDAAWSLLPAVIQAVKTGGSVALAVEGASARDLIPTDRLPPQVEYRSATLDRGRAGSLTLALPDLLRWADAVLAAGSLEFYAGLAGLVKEARFGLSRGFAQVLYPGAFLCGVGACQGCTADVAGGRRRVCIRGPVFDLVDVAPT